MACKELSRIEWVLLGVLAAIFAGILALVGAVAWSEAPPRSEFSPAEEAVEHTQRSLTECRQSGNDCDPELWD